MDTATIVGLVLAWGALIGSVLLEGGQLKSFISIPAAVLVFGGTIGAGMISFKMNSVTGIPGIIRNAFMGKAQDPGAVIKLMVGFAEKARREGLLILEDDVKQLNDEFLQRGIQLAIDGTDPELVREILGTEIQFLESRHKVGAQLFATFGGFAPTLGIIGTVMGLVHMLANLSNPGSMGPAIASAFIATLYGVSSANLIFLPISNKLKTRNEEEVVIREMMVEGIMAIQAGDNPRIVEEKLRAFLAPKIRKALAEVTGK